MTNYLENTSVSTTLLGIRLGSNQKYTVVVNRRECVLSDDTKVTVQSDTKQGLDPVQAQSQLHLSAGFSSMRLDDSDGEVDKTPVRIFLLHSSNVPDAIKTFNDTVLSKLDLKVSLYILSDSSDKSITIPISPNLVEVTKTSFKPNSEDLDKQLLDKVSAHNKIHFDTHLNFYKTFYTHLTTLSNKKADLNLRGFTKAGEAAENLEQALSSFLEKYKHTCQTADDYQAFSKLCHQAIEEAGVELNQHRGWSDILTNLALAAAGLVVFYVAACAFKYLATGSFFAHSPTASELITLDIGKSISTLGPAAAA